MLSEHSVARANIVRGIRAIADEFFWDLRNSGIPEAEQVESVVSTLEVAIAQIADELRARSR